MSVMNTQTPPAGVARDDGTMAPLIAIVGCDGSGKTTLASWISSTLPVTYCYLGLGTGNIAEKLSNWPLIGKLLVRRMSAKARQARTKGERIPGALTALVIYGFTLLRLHRFKRMLSLRKAGQVVVCDRYPQVEVPGFNDGPGLSAARPKGPFTAWLARSEHRLFKRMAAYHPTLVIRLHIDADTAHARKPDHDLSLLRAKAAVIPKLDFNGARIVDLDASQPLADIKATILELVQGVMEEHQHGHQPAPRPAILSLPVLEGSAPARPKKAKPLEEPVAS